MKFFETSKYYTLKRSTYISLRWIGIIGQLVTSYLVYFYFNFEFNFLYANLVIFFGILSNMYLMFVYNKSQISDRSSLIFLIIDILQLSLLIYLTGGVVNPFIIFLLMNFVILKIINLYIMRTNQNLLFLLMTIN